MIKSQCLICQCNADSATGICSFCAADLPWLGHCCTICALPLPQTAPALCGPCGRRPSPLTKTICAFRYQGTIAPLLTRFKFHHQLDVGHALSQAFEQRLNDIPIAAMPQAIIPVPLHRIRLQERGFNQAFELVRAFARKRHIPILANACIRHRYTPDQVGLTALQRRRNLRGAFALGAQKLPAHIAIVDDVITTGATALNLARVLKRAGVQNIELWVLARAL